GADLVRGAAQGILEQCQQQFVLTVELQVEAAQRLFRPIHDLLDREIGGAFFGDDRLGGIEEPLHALFGPQLRGADRALYRTLLPGGLFAGGGHRPAHPIPSIPYEENMGALYRRTSHVRAGTSGVRTIEETINFISRECYSPERNATPP